ncbi:neuraminidase-like domain-containing protein [Pseudomonas entomophila]|uniref:neuraminidase-like domain-containing protein n=1 Tax=Pseudomonas entomophila TaxID=312306 RepID=UPI001EFFE543|nr:neuraminidase-like domain-containing protein [Pseudomonas entomophila]MCG8293113.1 Tc toxin subunit A [Pseudomonas entomophila]
MNDLVTRNDNTNPANRPDAATYMSLFEDDQTRCAPGALMANNGRLAYLVHLKEMIQAFETHADVSAPITLQQRRPDLLALSLDEKNTRKVLPKIRMVLDVLESRASQALPEQQSLQQAVANGLYQANVPFHHAWESIKAPLASKQLHLWDVLRSTHASYPAFAFDNLTLADQRAATVLSSGFSPELQSQLLAPPLPPTPLMPDLASLSVAHLIEENRRREDELEEHLHRVSEPEERLHLEAELEKCRLREAELEDYRQQEAQLEEYQRQETEFYKRHFRISDSNPLGRLNTTQKLTKALGLSRRELRKLLAVNAIGEGNTSVTRSVHASAGTVAAPSSQVFGAAYINNAAAPLYLTERVQQAVKASASKPAKKTVAIIGLTSAHLDRLQRILRIQRALGLTATETDTLVMAALRAEGQTGDYHLTGTTLRALGMFSHLRQKYSVTPWQYAAFLDVISPYATGQQVSFYDKLFAPTHTDEGAPTERLLTLDDSPFDLDASQDDDALTVDQLALGMKVNREVLVVLLGWVCQAQGLQKPTRSLAVVSACYRMVTLLRLFGGSVAEGLVMLGLLMQEQPAYLDQLAGIPTLNSTLDTPDIIDVIAGLINALEWQQHQKLDTLQVFALLHREQAKFQKNWACAFEADTFKANPQLSPEPEKQDDDTKPEGGTRPEVIEPAPLSTVATGPQTAHDAKQPPRVKTEEEREAACYAALSLPLIKALNLEPSTLVEPLLMWAGVDPQALYQRMLDIQKQHLTNVPLVSLFLPSDLSTWSRLQRYSALITLFKLSTTAVKHFARHPAWFDLDLSHCETSYDYAFSGVFIAQDTQVLHFTTLYQLDRYNALLARLAKGKHEDDVLEYLKQANGETAGTGDPWLALEDLLGLPRTKLSALNIATPPRTLRDLDRLLRLQELADKHHLSLATLLELGKLPQAEGYDAFEQTAIALRRGCSTKQRKALDAQLSVAWRDALMQWMIVHWVPGSTAPNWINSPQTLADYLLIDLQVSHEPLTTRTLSATASLQRYLHQIHSHLENGYRDVAIGEEEREEWENFSSSYERWELRKSAHNEPQNYIDPTRRTRKTNAFKDLENLLAQGKCTPADVQTALESYLSTFETLSNIQPISVYADGTSPMTDTYHFIGKTNVEPVEYYWRTLDMSLRNQDGAPSMLAWGEWEKITLGITGKLAVTPPPKKAPLLYVKGEGTEEEEKAKEDAAEAARKHEEERLVEDLRTHIELIRPVIIAGRRYAVWAEWGANPIPMGPDNKASDYYPLRVCFAFQQTDGAWSPPNELLLLDGHGPDGKFDPRVEPSVERLNLKTNETEVVTTPENGTAPGNAFLKTKDFQPGLMAMVNQMGGREHDPWFMVMLYDAQKKEYWQANKDYFLVTKDLLLLESKMLDQVERGYRPIENKMVSNWLKFFHDPRTVQHPYVGSSIYLNEESNNSTLASNISNKKTDPKYSITKSGEITLIKPTQPTNGIITLSYKLDGSWKYREVYQTFEPHTLSHTGIGVVGTVEFTKLKGFNTDTKLETILGVICKLEKMKTHQIKSFIRGTENTYKTFIEKHKPHKIFLFKAETSTTHDAISIIKSTPRTALILTTMFSGKKITPYTSYVRTTPKAILMDHLNRQHTPTRKTKQTKIPP